MIKTLEKSGKTTDEAVSKALAELGLERDDVSVEIVERGKSGFLGIGEKYHAVPWSSLDYEKSHGGYVVPFTREQLEAAPVHDINDLTGGDGRAARDASYEYYKVPPYWI